MLLNRQPAQRDAVTDFFNADIRIFKADHPTRLAFLLAYRHGLREGPAVAWNRALDMARERFPRVGDHQLQCMLLLALGLYEVTDCLKRTRSGHPRDLADHMHVLIKGRLAFRLPYAATPCRHPTIARFVPRRRSRGATLLNRASHDQRSRKAPGFRTIAVWQVDSTGGSPSMSECRHYNKVRED